VNAATVSGTPTTETPFNIGWIVVAAVVGFVLLGILGLVSFAALAFVITGIVGSGAA
jgi:hypothetical protein